MLHEFIVAYLNNSTMFFLFVDLNDLFFFSIVMFKKKQYIFKFKACEP